MPAQAYRCHDCNRHARDWNKGEMVMLEDRLWSKVSMHKRDVLCRSCIEDILGRNLRAEDLRDPDIPVNKDALCEMSPAVPVDGLQGPPLTAPRTHHL